MRKALIGSTLAAVAVAGVSAALAGKASAQVNAELLTASADRDGLTFEVYAHRGQPVMVVVPKCDSIYSTDAGEGMYTKTAGEHDRFATFELYEKDNGSAVEVPSVGHVRTDSGQGYSLTVHPITGDAAKQETQPTQILIEASEASCSQPD